MIEVYIILTGKYDPTLPSILHRTTRGSTIYANTTLRYWVSLWNSLPTHVITADSVG